MIEELRNKLPGSFLDKGKVLAFGEEMVKGVSKGKSNYPENYTFDPLEEAQQECVDIATYAMIEFYRIGILREKLDGLDCKRS